jgi:hypothetical protein
MSNPRGVPQSLQRGKNLGLPTEELAILGKHALIAQIFLDELREMAPSKDLVAVRGFAEKVMARYS